MDIDQIYFPELGRVELRRARAPKFEPAAHEVVVAPYYLGICGSDLHVLHGRHPFIKPPLVIGHEASARVLATGRAVERLEVGDDVVLNPLVHCGQCRACRAGRHNHCEVASVIGFRHDGIGQTRFMAAAEQFHRVPAGLSARAASLAEPLAVGYHAARRAEDLEKVLVIGGGTIGLSLLLALRDRQARRVVVVEPNEAKHEIARGLGADEVMIPDQAQDLPCDFTTVFDCVCTQDTLNQACDRTIGGGCVVAVGVPEQSMGFELPRMQRFEIDLHGSGMYTGEDIEAAMAAMVGRERRYAQLISETISIERCADAYEHAGAGDAIKILIDISE